MSRWADGSPWIRLESLGDRLVGEVHWSAAEWDFLRTVTWQNPLLEEHETEKTEKGEVNWAETPYLLRSSLELVMAGCETGENSEGE